ncbi:MAG: site-2 protease family protein, partial [Elusimicrobiota bacterium]
MLISLLGIAVTLGVAILVHEAGHFAACRYFKVKVERFAIGFGPKLVGISDKQGTEFVIRAIPLGGYVKMAGELVEDIKGEPDEYFSKPWWQRSIISFSGPFMNYVTAVIIFAGVYAL